MTTVMSGQRNANQRLNMDQGTDIDRSQPLLSIERKRYKNKMMICIVFFLLVSWCLGSPSIPNATSRMALAHALASSQSPTIDEVASIEHDRAYFAGHYYSDKAPGVSILAVPGVAVAELGSRVLHISNKLLREDGHTRSVRYYLVVAGAMVFVLIPLSVAGVAAFRQALLDAGTPERIANVSTIYMAFGTPYLIWSTLALGHATAAALLMLGFAQYWALVVGSAQPKVRVAVAGLFLGLAVLVEFIAAPASIAIGVLLVTRCWRVDRWPGVARSAGLLAVGGLIPALMLMAYNMRAFGSPLHLGYSSVDGWEGMRQGFFGISRPKLSVLWAITFGYYRGLFWLSPILISAIYGCLTLLWQPRYRPGAIAILFIAVCYFSINAGYFYWDGGYSTGPRHVTPALPFLIFGLALAYQKFPQWLRAVTTIAGAYGVLMVTLCTIVEKRSRDDGLPMLTGHVFPKLLAGQADTMTAHALPLAIVIALPFVAIGALTWRLGLLRSSPHVETS